MKNKLAAMMFVLLAVLLTSPMALANAKQQCTKLSEAAEAVMEVRQTTPITRAMFLSQTTSPLAIAYINKAYDEEAQTTQIDIQYAIAMFKYKAFINCMESY